MAPDQCARRPIPPDYFGDALLLFRDREEEKPLQHRAVTADRNRQDPHRISNRERRLPRQQRDA
jgi:hypothetical protein